jgi:ubiquinol oxidase
MRSLTTLLTTLLAGATAFTFGPHLRTWSTKITKETLHNLTPLSASTSPEDDTEIKAAQPQSTAVFSVTTTPAPKEARMMDENIFTFNKVLIDTVYNIICFLYPVTGGARDFARFFVLETVARVPYFAYLSVLHLRETFGERSDEMSERMRTHYAEADNELHHLLIMESLGGNSSAIDRTVAQTMAFFYYWYVIVIFSVSEPAAYHLSELIEDHAYDTYNGYLTNYEEALKSKPVPAIARKYYEEDNPFLFDLFCTVKNKDETTGDFSTRRPKLESLYDVFANVRDDEREHWKTLCNLVQYGDMQGIENKLVKGTQPKPKEIEGVTE